MADKILIIDIDNSAHHVTRAGKCFVYGGPICTAPISILDDAEKIPDYGRGLKRPKAIMERLRAMGWNYETRFDAGHGRSYSLCAYHSPQERRVTLAAHDGITNLRQWHQDCGGALEELDVLIARSALAEAAHGA